MPTNATITPDMVLKTLGSVRSGRMFDLGVSIALGVARMPGQQPYSFTIATTPASTREMLRSLGMESDMGFSIEKIEMDLHTGTHVDALGHAARGETLHGDARVDEVVRERGLASLASQEIPPIVTRGVLVDVAKAAGVKSLPLGHVVTADQVSSALDGAGVELREGDAALVHTGWLGEQFGDQQAYAQPGYPGIDLSAADLLIERGAFAIAVDNISVEPMMSQQPGNLAEVHLRCLVDAGCYLLENVQTQDLADEGVTEFAFVCSSVKFEGGTGGPVRPLALI
jgi:kynurenine formamidase